MRMRFETLISAYYKVSPFVILFGEVDLARYVQFWMLIPFAINGVFLWVSWNQTNWKATTLRLLGLPLKQATYFGILRIVGIFSSFVASSHVPYPDRLSR